MLESIQLRREDNTTVISLPVTASRGTSTFVVKEVEGLGPVKANIALSSFADIDGSVYQSSKVDARNIVMRIGYNPEYYHNTRNSVATLRKMLYDVFPTKALVTLLFVDDSGEVVRINGYVESHEPVIFSNDPEVQISIICPEPYFVDFYHKSVEGTTWIDQESSMFGSAPSGFQFDMTLQQAETWIRITTYPGMDFLYTGDMRQNDRVIIDTNRGAKKVRIVRGSTLIDDLDGITTGSLSMTVDATIQRLRVRNSSNVQSPYRFWYRPQYLGI